MSAPIGPGDWVECVAQSSTGLFSVGGIYRVAELGRDGTCSRCAGCAGIRICGRPNPRDIGLVSSEWMNWWPSCAFRPVYRPKSKLIDSLKAPPKRVKESA